ncbi:TetR/AcrR family transcriptional regulator [Ancylomarina sp. 16SWW S1-10-2]|uniref:TetR/AcrR family transcriptional regulator n=1 Tax=Ancylomarina sp. 16SWW S1-10-2 TaxID=2499681 RepID=UPI0012ADF0D9|nr:TetR/AcrR family transcriptional regulator [Ancylomarina sp. 16SWW S1-10-2]MRT92798.1 TetR/AcrR family transcriptional regulator [Ancylomarina sp. 16SWW S1-10-2]
MAKSDKAEIHEMVIKVAQNMMLKYGLRGLNMLELASECGLAKATLYKVIRTKEELVKEIALEILNVNIIKVLEPYHTFDEPIEATKVFLDNYFNYAIKAQKILTQQIYKEYPLIEKNIEEKYEEQMKIVSQCYFEWQEKGLIRKDINVAYCMDALRALNEIYITGPYSEEETIDRLRTSFRCLFRGMGIKI